MKKCLEFILQRKNFIYFNIFFLLALVFNLNNKTLVIFSAGYLITASFIYQSLSKGFIFSYLLFQLFLVGKTYEILLIPADWLAYGKDIIGYQGHYQYIIIGPSFIIGMFMVLWFFYLGGKRKITVEKDLVILSLFFIASFISSFFSVNNQIALFYWLNTLPLLPFYYFLKLNLSADKNLKNELIKFFFLLVIYESIWAILQYFKRGQIIPSLEFISIIPFAGLDMVGNWFRPWGSLSHPNDLAHFLLPFTIFSLLSGYYFRKSIPQFILAGFSLSALTIILTLSRSAWGTFFFVCLFFILIFEKKYRLQLNLFYKKGLLRLIILFVPFVIIFVIPRLEKTILTFSSGGSGLSRIELIKESLNLIYKYPLLGVGYGTSTLAMFLENPKGEMYYFPTVVHNMYLLMANETGIVATSLFFIFLAYLILSRRDKSLDINRQVKRGIFFASFVSLLLNGFFQPFANMLYLIIFATLYYYVE